ncbi:hypothetical protein niasHS_015080 [Heterodera schachtii]|uniref:C2H2-type domain-containing protein n=1 Tax=Heterodera schachtii TaxID=97005 RepID=A0ABD2IAJ6_HETSC
MVYNCQLCIDESGEGVQPAMQFPSFDQFEAHLAADHFGVLPYECEQCQFAKFPTEFAVVKHNEIDHGNRSYSFRCRITPEVKAKRRKVREFLSALKTDGGQSSAIGLSSLRPQQQNVALLGRGGARNQQLQQQTNAANASGQNDGFSTVKSSANKFATIKKEINDLDELSAEERNAKDGTKQTNDQSQRKDEGVGFERNGAIVDESPASLTEQIQAACLQKIRREGAEGGVAGAVGSGRLRPSAYGGTLEIREGAELTVAALMNAANAAGDGRADDGLIEEMDGQQADVQEILKAAAAAVSQVGAAAHAQQQQPQHAAFGRRADLASNGGYSLRPNRFSPYALLHQGISAQQYQIGRDSAGQAQSFSLFQGELKREKVIDRIQCRKCKEMINAQGGCLNHHTNTRHLRLPMFQCTLCNKDFFEVSNTRIHKHMRLHHAGDTKHLVSNYHKYSAALHAARDECFGRKEERIHAMRNPPPQAALAQQQTMDFCASAANVGGGAANLGRLKRAPVTDPCATVRAVLRNHHEQWPTNENRKNRTEVNSANSSSVQTSKQSQQRKTERNAEQRNTDRNEEEAEKGIGTIKTEEAAEEETEEQRKSTDVYEKDHMEMNEDSEFQQMDSLEPENEQEDEQMEEEEEDEEEEDEGCDGDDGPVHPMLAMMDAASKGADELAEMTHHQTQQRIPAAERTETAKMHKNFVSSRAGDPSSSSHQHQFSGSDALVGQPRTVRPSNGGHHQQNQQQRHISYVGTDEKVPCKLCGEMVWNKITNRLNHINVRHLQLPLHECAICHKSFASYSRSACYSHVQFAHKTEIESGQCSSVIEEHIIYRKDCYNTQLMEAARDYF